MATNQAIFNAIWDGASTSFKSRIPKMDSKNQAEIGALITSANYTAEMNEWLTEAVNRIGMVLIHNNYLRNRLGKYIYGTMEFGDAIEELMVNVIKGEDYEPGTEGSTVDPFRITNPDVKAIYHKVNSRRKYRVTTYPDRAKRAFLNEGGLQTLISQIISQLSSAAQLDDWISIKNVFNVFINGHEIEPQADQIVTVTPVTDNASGKEFINTIKNLGTAMAFPTAKFNQMKITKMVNPDELTLFVRADLLNNIDVNVLSSAFNRSDLNLSPSGEGGTIKIEPMDDFGGVYPADSSGNKIYPKYDAHGKVIGYTTTEDGSIDATPAKWVDPNKDVIAILAETRFPLITRQLERAESIWNPEGLYWNNFMHMWSQYGYSAFMNAVIIKAVDSTTTG